jgi:hypothetical protein
MVNASIMPTLLSLLVTFDKASDAAPAKPGRGNYSSACVPLTPKRIATHRPKTEFGSKPLPNPSNGGSLYRQIASKSGYRGFLP